MCSSSPHFIVLALAPWQQSILCWSAVGLWITWKSNSCEVCKKGLCVNMAPSVHGPIFAIDGTHWQSPTLTPSCRSERISPLGYFGSKLIPVSQQYLIDHARCAWRTIPGSLCGRCVPQLRFRLFTPVILETHWRAWGHTLCVCYASGLCLHLFKGDSSVSTMALKQLGR